MSNPDENGAGASSGVPPGLEKLASLDQILVEELKRGDPCCLRKNTPHCFNFRDAEGRIIFTGFHQHAGHKLFDAHVPRKSFCLVIHDEEGHGIVLERNLVCWACSLTGSIESIRVISTSGEYLGSIEERSRWCCKSTVLEIRNGDGEVILLAEGPYDHSICCCHSSVDFKIRGASEPADIDPLGHLEKTWTSCMKEQLTYADQSKVTFPKEMTPRLKAVCLGALFCMLLGLHK